MYGRPSPGEAPWGSSLEFECTLRAAQAGDSEALDQLFGHFYPTVQRLVHVSLARDMRAKRPWLASLFSTGDVVQEVFKNTLSDIGSFQGTSEREFVGYLAALVRNRLIDSVRFHQAGLRDRRRLRKIGESPEPRSKAPGPDAGLISDDDVQAYRAALGSFPEREQRLLRERLEHEARFQSIAERLGYPSADAARKAFNVAQARLLVRLRRSSGES